MFNPKVSHPHLSNAVAPMKSGGDQPLFFFGGAQTPVNLGLTPSQFQGSHSSFSQKQQVAAQTLQKLTNKKRSPVKVLPGGVGNLGLQKI
jgi:hypothetical protein